MPRGGGCDPLGEETALLLKAIRRLPEHERSIVMMRHFDGHSVRGIAEMTGRREGTVRKQLSRGYARLRKWLKEIAP